MTELDLDELVRIAAVLALEGEPGVSREYFTARLRLIEQLPAIIHRLHVAVCIETAANEFAYDLDFAVTWQRRKATALAVMSAVREEKP